MTLRVWKMPSHLSWMKLKSLHRVLEFIFPDWMQTYTFQASWRASWAPGNGWPQDLVRRVASPGAWLSGLLPGRMGNLVEDLGKQLEASAQMFCLIIAKVTSTNAPLTPSPRRTLHCQSQTPDSTLRDNSPTRWPQPTPPVLVLRTDVAVALANQKSPAPASP